VDARLCAAGVCRAWHAAADATLFASLDLSPHTGGLAHGPASDALLRAAAGRAAGALTALDVRGCEALTYRALIGVVREHAATLATLHTDLLCFEQQYYEPPAAVYAPGPLDVYRLEALLRAGAPALTCLGAHVLAATVPEAARLLEAEEAPLAPLRVHALHVSLRAPDVDDVTFARFLRALRAAPALRALCVPACMRLQGHGLLDGAARMDAFVDAVINAPRLRSLTLDCRLAWAPALLPPLARLLDDGDGGGGGGALEELELREAHRGHRPQAVGIGGAARPAQPADVADFRLALRAGGSLRELVARLHARFTVELQQPRLL
jgi:hypothetical protein